jgi:outer membrane protein OmpA-like peptidoglycan-associated protein
MSKPLSQELDEYQKLLVRIRKAYESDGTIPRDEHSRLDELEDKLKRLVSDMDRGGAENGNGLGGLDTGQLQAGPWETGEKVVKGAWNWITKQGVTTIIIENWTSKVLRNPLPKLLHPKESKFVAEPPTEIMAAKGPHDATIATMSVKTDKWIRGVTRADTSGFVVYDVMGTDKQRTVNGKTDLVRAKVRVAWSRKGEGQLNDEGTWTDLGGHLFEKQQVKEGTITYRFTEVAPSPKPAAPPPAAPAGIHVLFKQGKFELTSEGESQLHKFAVAYRESKSTSKIEVEGWASIEGVEASNKTLSFDRARAVFNYLVDKDKGGLSKDSVTWKGNEKPTSKFDPDVKKLEPNRRATINLK